MNQLAELQWERLFVSRWQQGKTLKKTIYYYTVWERVQIRGKGENPPILSLYVLGVGSKWQKAGSLKRREDEWVFEPTKTSDAPDILKATIIRYLT